MSSPSQIIPGSRLSQVNDSVTASGNLDGSISANSFTSAPFNANGTITQIIPIPVVGGAQTIITGLTGGSVTLPTALVNSLSGITPLPTPSASTTAVPVTGGFLSITNNFLTGVTSFNSGGSFLTPVGPISISSLTTINATSGAGAVVRNGVLTFFPSREDRVGDSFGASGTASGTLSGNTLNNFNYAVTGTISGLVFSPSGNVVPTSSQVAFAFNGGNVSLPTSLVNSLSASNSSSISPILQNFFVVRGNQPFTESEIQRFREIFSSQPTPPQSNRARSNNIAPPGARVSSDVISSLSNSRIGLGAW